VREAAAAVLVGPAGRVHHAIERQVIEHNNLAHCNSFLSTECLLTIYTNGFGSDRQECGNDWVNFWKDQPVVAYMACEQLQWLNDAEVRCQAAPMDQSL
jgi:hypothetical protein